jgi:ADP-ribosylglycohydrolase
MSKITDSIIGHAIGDAMGMPTEFCTREHLLSNPVVDMIGSKKVGQPAGTWTDDTSMEIATIESIVSNNGFNYSDIMSRWCDWLNKGEYTPNGVVFDVGRTCLKACRNFMNGIEPTKCGLSDENSNGNGSLMRILPVAIYSYINDLSNDELLKLTNDVSSLTHGHNISKLACYMYVKFIIRLLNGMSKEECYEYLKNDDYSMYDYNSISKYDRLINDDIRKFKIDDIKSSGYVVDTWECVLWILLNSKSYKETIIAATNIGQDTDTIGAIVGSMAGIIYGLDKAPKQWLDTLVKKDYLIDLANKFENLKGVKR